MTRYGRNLSLVEKPLDKLLPMVAIPDRRTLRASQYVRVVGVEAATLERWSARGVTKLSADQATRLISSEATRNQLLGELRTPVRHDDAGYVLHGPMPSADDD